MTGHVGRNAEIRRLFAVSTPIAELARRFGISVTRVYQIVGRVTAPQARPPLRDLSLTPALSQARAELAAEIRAAREEAATAPLYRSGPR